MKSTSLKLVVLLFSACALIGCAAQPAQTTTQTTSKRSGNGLAAYLH